MAKGGCNETATLSHRDTRFVPTPPTLSLFGTDGLHEVPQKVTLVFAVL